MNDEIMSKSVLEPKGSMPQTVYDLLLYQFITKKSALQNVFTVLSAAEYIGLHMISGITGNAHEFNQPVYLKELKESLQLSLQDVDKMSNALEEKGLVTWSYNKAKDREAFIKITESGRSLLHQQEERLRSYYGRIMESFGCENRNHLFKQMERLNEIAADEFRKE